MNKCNICNEQINYSDKVCDECYKHIKIIGFKIRKLRRSKCAHDQWEAVTLKVDIDKLMGK